MLGDNLPNSSSAAVVSIHDLLPSEVIRMLLSHLSLQQLLGVLRVKLLWRFLGRSLLNDFLKKEYPFLKAEKLNDSDCIVLIENQQAIYADKDKADFTPEQKAFLTELAIASGMRGESEDKEKAFELIAEIGNKEMLEAWHNDKSISAEHKGKALRVVAYNGHLGCVEYFIKNIETEISSEDKGGALRLAAMKGHLGCVEYFIKNIGTEISSEDKGEALRLAAMKGHLGCVEYFIKNIGTEISSKYKGGALRLAAMNGRNEVKDYLEGDISSHKPGRALIFTKIENKDEECFQQEKRARRRQRK